MIVQGKEEEVAIFSQKRTCQLPFNYFVFSILKTVGLEISWKGVYIGREY